MKYGSVFLIVRRQLYVRRGRRVKGRQPVYFGAGRPARCPVPCSPRPVTPAMPVRGLDDVQVVAVTRTAVTIPSRAVAV